MERRERSFDMETRPYEFRDFESVRDLYQRVWKEQRGFDYDRMRLRDTISDLPVATIATFEGALGGFFTIWPMTLTDGRQSVSAGQAMDVMTDERFRGKGVFPKLATLTAHDALKRGMKLLYGVPNEAVYETYIKRLAWASPTVVRTVVRPLSLRGKHPMLGVADFAFSSLPGASSAGFNINHGPPSSETITAAIGQNQRPKGVWRVEKSIEWLRFRYQDNERFSYHWVSVSGGDPDGAIVVWGIDKSQEGMRRANLLEIIGRDTRARAVAVAAACKRAQRAGADYMAAITTSRATAGWLRRTSFLPVKQSPLIVKTLDPSPFSANPFDKDGWDLFGGDFDFV